MDLGYETFRQIFGAEVEREGREEFRGEAEEGRGRPTKQIFPYKFWLEIQVAEPPPPPLRAYLEL